MVIYRGDTTIVGPHLIGSPVVPGSSTDVANEAMAAAWDVVSSTIMQNTTEHDALAYRARTEAALLNAGSTDLTTTTLTNTLDALWDDRYLSATTQPGFGLSTTFDAFQDGSTNPADTIYSYTSTIAALAFLDGHEVLGGTTQLERARDVLDTLLSDLWGWTSGSWMSVWYSDQAADQTGESRVVNNVNALTLATLARIDRIDAAAYDSTKRTGMEAFVAAGEGYNGVAGRWRYRMTSSALNDLTHHAYMVIGVAEAAMTTELGLALDYLWENFLNGDGTIDTNSSAVMGTNDWGPGDGLVGLCMDSSAEANARVLAADITDSIDVNGISAYADSGNARSVCRYGLGLAFYAASILGDGSLFP